MSGEYKEIGETESLESLIGKSEQELISLREEYRGVIISTWRDRLDGLEFDYISQRERLSRDVNFNGRNIGTYFCAEYKPPFKGSCFNFVHGTNLLLDKNNWGTYLLYKKALDPKEGKLKELVDENSGVLLFDNWGRLSDEDRRRYYEIILKKNKVGVTKDIFGCMLFLFSSSNFAIPSSNTKD